MNKKNIEQGLNAYYGYIEKEENIEKDVLDYISERISANKDTIEKLISMTKEKVDIDKIKKSLKKESRYKNETDFAISEADFINGVITTSKGIILKEESDVEKVVETFIDAILSRNTVVVADIEFSEVSVKNLILEIMQIALEKFDIDKNLLQLLPYEGVNDDEFNLYKENGKVYIYLEDKDFINEVDKEYLVEGEIDEVIEEINQDGVCECAVIYTKDREKAYRFINRVNGKNVFVNTKWSNMRSDLAIDEWYICKNVIYPNH